MVILVHSAWYAWYSKDLFTTVPNYGSEVYGDDSICVEVSSTLGDCLPRGGTPRCYQRQVVQQNGTDELAFSINIRGKQANACGAPPENTLK